MSNLEAASLFGVKGLVAVITGGSSGLGAMMAKALETNGAKVYILGRRKDKLEAVAKAAVNGSILPIECDVTSKESLVAAAEQVGSGVGFMNVFIANAGISGPLLDLPKNPELADWQKELFKVPMEDFSKTSEVNVAAAFYSMLAFLPLLDAGNARKNVEQKSQVIITSSIAGFIREVPASFSYGVSKAAATHLMKSMATTFAPWHIRANVIAPGLYESEMTEGWFKGVENATKEGAFPKDFIPLTRAGGEEDMAGVVLFLCSKAGGYVNGNVVVTDGGVLTLRPATY